jgi:hypothetical protein
MKEYEQNKALRLLAKTLRLLADDIRPEVKPIREDADNLVSYLRHHGDESVKELIQHLWG